MTMDTSKMKKIEEISSDHFSSIRDNLLDFKRSFEQLYPLVETQVLYDQLKELFEVHYDLGEVKEIFEVFGGYTNRSFGVVCQKDGISKDYFVRKYKQEVTEDDVTMEHRLISYAIDHGFKEAAGVFPAKNGQTYVKLRELKHGQLKIRIFSIYRYLNGLDKYTWIDNQSTPKENFNLGHLLARLHDCTRDFVPGDNLVKSEPKIEFLMPGLKNIFAERVSRLHEGMFHSYFSSTLPLVLEAIDNNAISAEDFAVMPQTPIHGDFHAGNVKFDGEDTVGLFDFDWSKIDVRLFDICLGLVYCTGSWTMSTDGNLRPEDCRQFLRGYHEALNGHGLSQLNEVEKRVFVKMLNTAVIYLVYWLTELWYYLDPDNINDYEAVSYLMHFLRTLKWIKANEDQLAGLVLDL